MDDRQYRQWQLDAALVQAADCDPEAAAELIAEGAEVSGIPLIMAIQCDCYEVAKLLVDAGSNVNANYENITTPLIHAITAGYDYMVSLLIQAGADVNVPHPQTKHSPLQIARECEYRTAIREANRPKIIRILEEAGAK